MKQARQGPRAEVWSELSLAERQRGYVNTVAYLRNTEHTVYSKCTSDRTLTAPLLPHARFNAITAVVFKSPNYTGSSKVLVCAKVVLRMWEDPCYAIVKVGAGRALRQLTRLYVSDTTALVLFIQERTDNIITRAHVNDRVFVFHDSFNEFVSNIWERFHVRSVSALTGLSIPWL